MKTEKEIDQILSLSKARRRLINSDVPGWVLVRSDLAAQIAPEITLDTTRLIWEGGLGVQIYGDPYYTDDEVLFSIVDEIRIDDMKEFIRETKS